MNNGFNNEHDICKALNGKKVKELLPFLQNVVKTIFKFIEDDDVITSKICERSSKPDIYIKYEEEKAFISIKSGRTNSIHFEKISEFVDYLKLKKISNETIETILLFHYGDGNKRLLYDELFPIMNKRIQRANIELNQKHIVEDLIDRFIFNGVERKKISVDYILHGNKNYGIMCSKEQIKKFIFRKTYNHIKTLHVGPLTLQPFLRDVNDISKNKYKREYIQIKWHYMLSDLEFINNYY